MTYYIDPYGSDSSGDGSVLAPWKTLAWACEHVTVFGDVIHVNSHPTYYTETVESQLRAGVSIEGDGKTTTRFVSSISGNYVATIRLYSNVEGTAGNQHISGITLDGNNLTTYWGIITLGRSWVLIYDCNIVDYISNGVLFYGRTDTEYLAPSIYALNNQVYSCEIINCCRYQHLVGGTGNVNFQGQKDAQFHENISTHNQRATYQNGNGVKTTGWIDGLKISGNTFNGDVNSNKSYTDSYDFCVELWGVNKTNIEICNNIFYNNEVDIAGGTTTNVNIHDNWIGCTSLLPYQKIGIIMETDDSLSNVLIKNNHFQNLSNNIAFYPTLNSNISNVRIQSNVFENIGKTIPGWNNSWGISYSISSGPPFTTTNWYIENNTFIAATVPGASESAAVKLWNVPGSTVNHIYIRNNIIRDFEGYPVFSDNLGSLDYLNFTYNNIYNCGNPIFLAVVPTNSDILTGNITSNPLLTDSFHVTEPSPVKGAGIDVGILTDKDNVAYLNPPAMGAYEYVPVRKLTTINIVGNSPVHLMAKPSWITVENNATHAILPVGSLITDGMVLAIYPNSSNPGGYRYGFVILNDSLPNPDELSIRVVQDMNPTGPTVSVNIDSDPSNRIILVSNGPNTTAPDWNFLDINFTPYNSNLGDGVFLDIYYSFTRNGVPEGSGNWSGSNNIPLSRQINLSSPVISTDNFEVLVWSL